MVKQKKETFEERVAKRCFKCGQFVPKDNVVLIQVEGSLPFKMHHECYEEAIKVVSNKLAFADRLDVKAHDLIESWFVYVSTTRIANMSLFIDDYLSENPKRSNRGRPSIGPSRKLSVSLPPGEWEFIDELVDSGQHASNSEYFRHLHELYRMNMLPEKEVQHV